MFKGSLSEQDIAFFKSKLITINNSKFESIAEFLLEKNRINQPYICLISTNYSSIIINDLMIDKLNIKYDEIESISNKKHKNYSKICDYSTCVLNVLKIGVGCRVMLRKNIDFKNKLSNGALGTVILVKKNHKNFVTEIDIMFDKTKEIHSIKRTEIEVEITTNNFIIAYQFPLILAWAITIHKIQGETLDYCLVDISLFVAFF